MARLVGAEDLEQTLVLERARGGRLRAKPERSGCSRPPPPESSASTPKSLSRERQQSVARGGFGGMLAREARRVDGLVAPEQPAGVRVAADPVGQEPEIPFDDLQRHAAVLEPWRPVYSEKTKWPPGARLSRTRPQNRLGIGDVMQEVVGEDQIPRPLGERVGLRVDPRVGDGGEPARAQPLSRPLPPMRRSCRLRGSRRCPPDARARARGNRSRIRG